MSEPCEVCGEYPHEPKFPSILEDVSWGNPHKFKPPLEAIRDMPGFMAVVEKYTLEQINYLLRGL